MGEQMPEFKKWLEGQGFRFGLDPLRSELNLCDWYAWRRSALPARECECNGPKCQIVVHPHAFQLDARLSETVEVELCGEAGDVWWKLRAYSMTPQQAMAKLPQVEASLVAAWNALLPSSSEG